MHQVFFFAIGEKPHSCEVCGKPFRVRSDMKRHLKTHGRRRARHLQTAPAQLVVAKLEEPEKTELIIDSDEEEEEVVLSEEILEAESAVEELHYDQATLESVREGNTLYVHFFVSLLTLTRPSFKPLVCFCLCSFSSACYYFVLISNFSVFTCFPTHLVYRHLLQMFVKKVTKGTLKFVKLHQKLF